MAPIDSTASMDSSDSTTAADPSPSPAVQPLDPTPNADVADAPEVTFTDLAPTPAPASPSTDETPTPRLPKMGKTVIVRRRGKVDAPALIVAVDPRHLVTAVIFYGDHPLETVHNAREIHPSEKLTGWYWPEE